MRDIKDLKENECIKVESRGQLNKILSFMMDSGIYYAPEGHIEQIKSMYNKGVSTYLFYSGKEKYICFLSCNDKIANKKTVPASDFLPKSKSLRKEVKQLRKDMQQLRQVVANKCEVIESGLPKHWCIQVTADNQSVLQKYLPEHDTRTMIIGSWYTSDNGMFSSVGSGYTEISFDDFKRLVLKETEKPKEIDFSVPGQIVGKVGYKFLTTGITEECIFTGVCVYTECDSESYIGEVVCDLPKHIYKINTEPITLQNK